MPVTPKSPIQTETEESEAEESIEVNDVAKQHNCIGTNNNNNPTLRSD